jgi:GWxTD domain-containing protein
MLCAAVVFAGCGGWKRVGTEEAQPATQGFTEMFDQQAFMIRLGRLAAGDPLPFTGAVAQVRGPGDSIQVVLGLSLENRALSFQRDKDSYIARYRVDVTFQSEGGRSVVGGQEETVRVANFQEAGRADESILFQKYFRLAPDTYTATVTIRDMQSGTQNRAQQKFVVIELPDATTSAPIIAYQASGREQFGQPLRIVLNPRGAVAFGGDTMLAYVEGYNYAARTKVPFRVVTQGDSVVLSDSLVFRGGIPVEAQVIKLRADSMALGELKLVVGSGATERSTAAVVSFSTAWLVTNYDEMLAMLRWFGHSDELDAVKRSLPERRAAAWLEFWRKTDPNPTTPENEGLNLYFARVAAAAERFRDEGVPGWRTERGEVLIRLGEPDDVFDQRGISQGGVIRWTYLNYRLTLYFADDNGFGRFRMTTDSRGEFERVAARIRPF